jgi:hypothetical protein
MNDSLGWYVTAVFVLTTLLTIWFVFRSFRRVRSDAAARNLITFVIPFWMILTAFLAIGGFYSEFQYIPPRVAVFGVLPGLIFVATLFVFFRPFLERLSIRVLTFLHIVRIPVELVLFWLFQAGLVPQIMTFEGRNANILFGITAPIIYWLAFRGDKYNRLLLIIWNALGLLSLANIVTIALFSFPSPFQRVGFEQPNIAVSQFPFIWLATIVVPIVLFAHLAVLWRLSRSQRYRQDPH